MCDVTCYCTTLYISFVVFSWKIAQREIFQTSDRFIGIYFAYLIATTLLPRYIWDVTCYCIILYFSFVVFSWKIAQREIFQTSVRFSGIFLFTQLPLHYSLDTCVMLLVMSLLNFSLVMFIFVYLIVTTLLPRYMCDNPSYCTILYFSFVVFNWKIAQRVIFQTNDRFSGIFFLFL